MDCEIDPVIEAYKKDVDRGLLREALKLTPEQRILKLIELQKFSAELHASTATPIRETRP